MGKIPTCLSQGMRIFNSLYFKAKQFSRTRLFGHFACNFLKFYIKMQIWHRFQSKQRSSSRLLKNVFKIVALNHGPPRKDIYRNFFEDIDNNWNCGLVEVFITFFFIFRWVNRNSTSEPYWTHHFGYKTSVTVFRLINFRFFGHFRLSEVMKTPTKP